MSDPHASGREPEALSEERLEELEKDLLLIESGRIGMTHLPVKSSEARALLQAAREREEARNAVINLAAAYERLQADRDAALARAASASEALALQEARTEAAEKERDTLRRATLERWGDRYPVEQERDQLRAQLAQVTKERDEARAGWDEACSIIATTADRLNVALRESGCLEMIGDPYRSLAIRDGIVALYDKGARWRASSDAHKDAVEQMADKLASSQANVRALAEALTASIEALERMYDRDKKNAGMRDLRVLNTARSALARVREAPETRRTTS